MKNQIVHCKKEKFDIYIGRNGFGFKNSRYGNPWIIGKHGSRAEVIEKYEKWLKTGENFGNSAATEQKRAEIMQNLDEIRDKILGCWCNFPAQDCHGRILKEFLKEKL